MKTLILTPTHVNNQHSLDVLEEMIEAIDRCSFYPFLHVLIDDNSSLEFMSRFVSKKRRGLKIYSDYAGVPHKNQLGQALQLGLDYANQKFCNEKKNDQYDNIFLIESDVVVKDQWDKKMIDESLALEKEVNQTGWFTLDCLSVDEKGELTYPNQGSKANRFSRIKFAEYQCTLINPNILYPKFSDFPSHFDILWSRRFSEMNNGGDRFWSTREVEVLHYPHTSRLEYM